MKREEYIRELGNLNSKVSEYTNKIFSLKRRFLLEEFGKGAEIVRGDLKVLSVLNKGKYLIIRFDNGDIETWGYLGNSTLYFYDGRIMI